jgi:DNA ligase (NAD+)
MEKYQSNFLKIISDKNNISLRESMIKLDKCFTKVANDSGINIRDVISEFYGLLNPEYDNFCEELTVEDCMDTQFCTTSSIGTCIPIFLRDYKIINEDPDKYIQNLLDEGKINSLMELRDLTAHLYYNVGNSGISDNSFDAIEYWIRKHNKKGLIEIGAIPIKKLQVELPYPMASLDKIHPDEKAYKYFLDNIPEKGLNWSDKLDGVSGMVIYNNGLPTALYTRGNGVIGGDITYLLEYINIPKNIEEKGLLVIRGELVIKKLLFTAKYRDLYSNARSFVVSQTNKGTITLSSMDINFVAYEIVNILSPTLDFLSLQGFEVVANGFLTKAVRMLDITLLYRERRENSEYDIDGLVLEYNISPKPAPTIENPQHKKAFKMQLEEQLRTTTVEDVDWDISRYGRYNPVAVYKPVYIDHVRITRATAHNAVHVRDWNMGVGTIIKITRSGDVIPQIKDVIVDKDIEVIYPSDEYEWYWVNKDIVLMDIDNNPRVQQKRILHFLQVTKIPGIGEKTVEKLYDSGFDTIKKLIQATPDRLTKVKGIGMVTAKKFKENVTKALSTLPPDRFLVALTLTEFKVSRKLVKEVLRTFPDILVEKHNSGEMKKLLESRKIKGIGVKRIEMIATQFPEFRKMLMDLDPENVENAFKHQKYLADMQKQFGYNPRIEGKTFVLTGFRDTPYDLEDIIYNNMGEISTSVVSSTAGVIAYSNMVITPKILMAKNFGIPIYTYLEFKEAILKSN